MEDVEVGCHGPRQFVNAGVEDELDHVGDAIGLPQELGFGQIELDSGAGRKMERRRYVGDFDLAFLGHEQRGI